MDSRQEQEAQRCDGRSSPPPQDDDDDYDNYDNCYHAYASNGKEADDLANTPPTLAVRGGAQAASRAQAVAARRPWYNQRLTIPISVLAVPPEPPQGEELSAAISQETWQAFRNRVHTAAGVVVVDVLADDESRTRTTSSSQQEDSQSYLSALITFLILCWVSFAIANMLVKYTGNVNSDEDEAFIIIFLIIWVGLRCIYRYWRHRMFTRWDEEYGPGLRAVCDEFSPRFQDECNYYVEYRGHQVIEFRNSNAFEKVPRGGQPPNAPIMTV